MSVLGSHLEASRRNQNFFKIGVMALLLSSRLAVSFLFNPPSLSYTFSNISRSYKIVGCLEAMSFQTVVSTVSSFQVPNELDNLIIVSTVLNAIVWSIEHSRIHLHVNVMKTWILC
jgi:hypothetical protein